jgi:hypothetical protein
VIIQQFLFRGHLDEDEKILYVGHKHWGEIIHSLFKYSLLGIAFPWGMYLFLGGTPFMWLAIVATVLTYIRLMYILTDWYFDAVLVTTQSLLFVEWHGFFHQESTRISYESVESISLETAGVWAVTFGFGTVSIERDSAPVIMMNNIRNPKKLELEIMRGKEKYEDRQTSENTDALHDILSQLVQQHIKKHGWKKKGM